ncbi:tyrosine recombinase XerS [Salipaludibacillus sp. CF4.18]|uniref:tyrosine recombinase XerS n=1 Tax=Salipaludibacillus sp. CF4.18 TaxID=3373081 RepID=UPI003EE7B0FC
MADRFNREKSIHLKKVNELKKEFPWYITEYIEAKKKHRMSPTTLAQYSRDYINFLKWLIEQDITHQRKLSDVPIESFGELRKSDAESYIDFLHIDRELSDVTVNRNISSLKSLFKYLSTQTEDADGECYFYRNVFAKIDLIRSEEDHSQKAATIASKIFQGNTDKEFLQHMVEEYPRQLSHRALAHHQRNIERDLAIVSLFLGSGIRVSELVQITLDDINFRQNSLNVLRKGNKKSVIMATKTSLDDVREFLKVRKEKYIALDNQKYVFVTKYAGKCNPLSIRSIQHIVGKYTETFILKRMSPHKFRHSFATKHWLANKDQVSLMRQLGHNSMETTTIYTNIDITDLEKQMDKMDEYTDQK